MLVIKAPSPTISIEKFDIDKENRVMRISGRASGLIGFLMSLAGVSPTATLTLLFDRLMFTQTRIGSESRTCFPLSATESVVSGQQRSVGLLVFAGIMLIAGINVAATTDPAAGIIPVLIALACAIAYFFSRKSYIEAHAGSQSIRIVFKPSSLAARTSTRQRSKAPSGSSATVSPKHSLKPEEHDRCQAFSTAPASNNP